MRLCIEFVIVSSKLWLLYIRVVSSRVSISVGVSTNGRLLTCQNSPRVLLQIGRTKGPATGSTGFVLGSCGIGRVLDVLGCLVFKNYNGIYNGIYHYNYDVLFQVFLQRRLWMVVRGLRLVRNGANCIKYIDGKGVAQCCPLQTKCLQDRSEEEDEGSSDGDEPRWSNDRHWTGSRGAAGHMLCTCYSLLMVSRCYFQLCLNCYFQFLLSKIIQIDALWCIVLGQAESTMSMDVMTPEPRQDAWWQAERKRQGQGKELWPTQGQTVQATAGRIHILPPIIHHVEMMETYIYIYILFETWLRVWLLSNFRLDLRLGLSSLLLQPIRGCM